MNTSIAGQSTGLNTEVEKIELADLASRIAGGMDVRLELLRSRSRAHDQRVIAAKRRLAREAIGQGYSLTDIAAWLHTTPSSVSRISRP